MTTKFSEFEFKGKTYVREVFESGPVRRVGVYRKPEPELPVETKLLHLLVKKLGGHSVDIIENNAFDFRQARPGFSVGNNRSIALQDIINLVRANPK